MQLQGDVKVFLFNWCCTFASGTLTRISNAPSSAFSLSCSSSGISFHAQFLGACDPNFKVWGVKGPLLRRTSSHVRHLALHFTVNSGVLVNCVSWAWVGMHCGFWELGLMGCNYRAMWRGLWWSSTRRWSWTLGKDHVGSQTLQGRFFQGLTLVGKLIWIVSLVFKFSVCTWLCDSALSCNLRFFGCRFMATGSFSLLFKQVLLEMTTFSGHYLGCIWVIVRSVLFDLIYGALTFFKCCVQWSSLLNWLFPLHSQKCT